MKYLQVTKDRCYDVYGESLTSTSSMYQTLHHQSHKNFNAVYFKMLNRLYDPLRSKLNNPYHIELFR